MEWNCTLRNSLLIKKIKFFLQAEPYLETLYKLQSNKYKLKINIFHTQQLYKLNILLKYKMNVDDETLSEKI